MIENKSNYTYKYSITTEDKSSPFLGGSDVTLTYYWYNNEFLTEDEYLLKVIDDVF